MTTPRQLITSTYREANFIAIGTVPTPDALTEGLDRLNALIESYFGFGMGEKLVDWEVPQPQRTAPEPTTYPQYPFPRDLPQDRYVYPPTNTRLLWGATTLTVYLPDLPLDGARMGLAVTSGATSIDPAPLLTIDGNGRLINGAPTLTFDKTAAPQQWFYRADLAQWVAVGTLGLDDTIPFPTDLDDLWIGLLAQRIAPRYNKPLSAETISMIKRMMTTAKTRYAQAQVTTYKANDTPRGVQTFAPTYGSGLNWP